MRVECFLLDLLVIGKLIQNNHFSLTSLPIQYPLRKTAGFLDSFYLLFSIIFRMQKIMKNINEVFGDSKF